MRFKILEIKTGIVCSLKLLYVSLCSKNITATKSRGSKHAFEKEKQKQNQEIETFSGYVKGVVKGG